MRWHYVILPSQLRNGRASVLWCSESGERDFEFWHVLKKNAATSRFLIIKLLIDAYHRKLDSWGAVTRIFIKRFVVRRGPTDLTVHYFFIYSREHSVARGNGMPSFHILCFQGINDMRYLYLISMIFNICFWYPWYKAFYCFLSMIYNIYEWCWWYSTSMYPWYIDNMYVIFLVVADFTDFVLLVLLQISFCMCCYRFRFLWQHLFIDIWYWFSIDIDIG